MSASAPQIPSISSDITFSTPEPFQPRPLIADILRTRFCIPDSIFLVESVDIAHTSDSKRWRAIRLLLGDGELCIQALLSAEMHRFVDRGEIAFGSYVKLPQFRLKWKESMNAESSLSKSHNNPGTFDGYSGQMVYLVVESVVVVGWNNTLTDPSIYGQSKIDHNPVEAEHQPRENSTAQSQLIEPEQAEPLHETRPASHEAEDKKDTVEIDDDFEVMAVSENKAAQNRKEVATAIVKHEQDMTTTAGGLPWSSKDPTRPVKLTKLRSIPNLPYKQNWSVNVLCVVSAISDVEPAGIPPYTQRQARLTDPSTDKHILLTVFLDPHLFNPHIGSVVLLFGVKNHRFDGGSLKKYASDRPKAGENWWYENPSQFTWCDVDGLHRWWAQNGIQV